MDDWALPDPEAESALHKTRLLGIEERPFKRITRHLVTHPSLVQTTTTAAEPIDYEQLKEDLILDFSHFDNSILRFQFLHDSNVRERQRYKDDQDRILQECQSAREANAELRAQLDVARATLAQRKKFDEMADKITSNRLLKPREEQTAALAKLEEECRELDKESETYSSVFRERRDQFNRIMEESMVLRRQIRDEKEEVDRREGMNDGAESEAGGNTPRPDASRNGSPAPEGDSQPKGDGEDMTPRPPASNTGTPMHDNSQLQPGDRAISRSRDGSRQPSREPTPRPEGEDEDMEEPKDSGNQTEAGTPQVSIEPPGDRMEVDS